MKRKIWILSIVILVAVFLASILIYNLNSPSLQMEQPIQECSNQGDYCIYDNIPSKMLYVNPVEDIPENLILNRIETLNKNFKKITSDEDTISDAFGLDQTKYVCLNGDKIVVIKYFHSICAPLEVGCGYSREALVCGDTYFIEQYSDATGPTLSGPFKI